jgi:hypothetical protein
MSGKRLNLRDQARELAEEILIPLAATLPSRVPGEEPEEEQGREVIDEPEAEQSVETAEPTTPKPAIVRQRSNGNGRTIMTKPQVENSIDALARVGPDLAPLSCRVPRKVRQELDRRVHELKGRGLKIKMEDVVTAALVLFLKIDD